MKTKAEIIKELEKLFDDFKNKETGLHDFYELAYFCYKKGRDDAFKVA